ncbi:MAG: carbohydrate kinase [Devosiaceae bacterium]
MITIAGEALYDVFPAMGADAQSQIALDAVTGGSPFNVACGLGRLGLSPLFFGGIANGQLGNRQAQILADAGVRGDAIVRKDNLVPLMVIALAEDGQPTYSYYGQSTADVDITRDDLSVLPGAPSLLHLGSYSLVLPPIADTLASLVAQLPLTSILTLDPNVRPMVEPNVEVWSARLEPLYQRADIIKLSDEDIAFLAPGQDPLVYAQGLHERSQAPVFLTRGHEGVSVICKDGARDVLAPKVDVVDTVGAGDSFQTTLIAWGSKPSVAERLHHRALGLDELCGIAEAAVAVAACICAQRGPVIPQAKALEAAISPRLFQRIFDDG